MEEISCRRDLAGILCNREAGHVDLSPYFTIIQDGKNNTSRGKVTEIHRKLVSNRFMEYWTDSWTGNG